MLLSKCAVYNRKKSKFIKQQGASRLSGSLRLKTPLSKSPLEVHFCFRDRKKLIQERFIRTFMYKIYRYMISISKNVYTDELDEIANKHNNTYNKTIKMKPFDVSPSIYIDFNEGYN